MKPATTWDARTTHHWQERLDVPAVYLYESIPSTNDVARTLAEQGAETMTVIIADQQTAGRGRAGRSWLSTSGSSLLCSILFRTASDQHTAPGAAPVRIGNAVAQAIKDVAGVAALVKWPNDVVIEGQGKVAGILCEATMRQQGTAYVVAGIGVNVNDPGGEFGSINAAAPKEITRGTLLERIVALLKPFSHYITKPLSDAELEGIRGRDILFGQQIESDNQLIGRAAGIARDGSLQVETDDGIRTVYSATIRLADTKAYPGARL